MRKKKNLAPRMEAVSSFMVAEPQTAAGHWHQLAPEGHPHYAQVWVELGCGMGGFTSECALRYPDVLLVGVERVPEALVVAMEKAKEAELSNVFFIGQDADLLDTWFAAGEIDRLYIHFCDPWHKKKQAKRRLTYRLFLNRYRKLLSPQGELWFKSDNQPLVAFTKDELENCAWTLSMSEDWHHDPSRPADDIMTEYEKKFVTQGYPIGRIVASPPRDL